MTPPPSVLVLYWYPGTDDLRAAIAHHLRSLDASDLAKQTTYVNTAMGVPRWVRRHPFAVIVLHTTLLAIRWSHLFRVLKKDVDWVANARCAKLALPQDEYDHSEILEEWLLELGVTKIVSNFDPDLRSILYPTLSKNVAMVKRFTGYIDEAAATRCASRLRPPESRDVDIVYRASHLPYWFGSQGQLKHQIASVIAPAAQSRGLTTDISTRSEDTIVGEGWLDFLMRGRVVLGCESGSSVLDRRGEVRAAIQHMLRNEPSLNFAEVSARMWGGWDAYRFFAISPRHFEAIMTRTCQVLVEGTYDGVLEPERHYIPLRRDFSNVDEVLEQVRDSTLVRSIADRAYDEILLPRAHTYRRVAEVVENAMDRSVAPTSLRAAARWRRVRASQTVAHAIATATPADARRFVTSARVTSHVNRIPLPVLAVVRARRQAQAARSKAEMIERTASSALRRRGFRRLLTAIALNRRVSEAMLDELLRLLIIRRALEGDAGFSVAVEASGSSVVVRSIRGLPPSRSETIRWDEVTDLVWDNRELGDHVEERLGAADSVPVSVGHEGVFRFTQLAQMIRVSDRARSALAELLEVDHGQPAR